MVRKLIIQNPDISKNEFTMLSEDAAVGATSLVVTSTQGFADADLVLIGGSCEQRCSETSEIHEIDTITPVTGMTITSGLLFQQYAQGGVTKLDCDQLKIYKSTDGGETYTLLATVDTDYANPQKCTVYLDLTGTDTDYYEYACYNSVAAFEYNRSEAIGPTWSDCPAGYITKDEFRALTCITGVGDDLLDEAIAYGASEISRRLYNPRIYSTGTSMSEHRLDVHPRLTFADSNLDNRPIDKNDFYAWEEPFDTVMGVPGPRTDVTSDIVSVDVDRQVIEFGTARPTANKRLNIIWHETWEKLKFDCVATTVAGEKRWMNIHLKQLNKLFAVNYLFENVPFKILQRGIPSWSMGGVNVSFDYDVMQKILDDNHKRAVKIIQSIELPYTAFTTIRRPQRVDLRDFVSTLNFRRTP